MNGQVERGNWIYIGPTIPPLGLQRHTLYRSAALPAALELIAAQKPAVRALFIPIRDLAVAKRKLASTGSLEHAANQEMLGIAKTTPH
jgi:hypothetical protein